jgi:hypothetical protein
MKLSRRGFLAAVPWIAWPFAHAHAANTSTAMDAGAVIGEFQWGQTSAEYLGKTLAVLGLGLPQHVSTLGGLGNAWCATLHYGNSRALVVTSGMEGLTSAPVILRGARDTLRFDGESWTLGDGNGGIWPLFQNMGRQAVECQSSGMVDRVMTKIQASLAT